MKRPSAQPVLVQRKRVGRAQASATAGPRILCGFQSSELRGELLSQPLSGSSGGPHLHYEIRETANQVPLNPATRGLKIEDNRKPLMKRLYVYPMDKNSCVNGQMEPAYFSLVPSKNGYAIKDNKKINADGRIGFGLEGENGIFLHFG